MNLRKALSVQILVLICLLLAACQPEKSNQTPAKTEKSARPSSEELAAEFPLLPLVENRRWHELLSAEAEAKNPGNNNETRQYSANRAANLVRQLRKDYPFENTPKRVQLGDIIYTRATRSFSLPAQVRYPHKGDASHPGDLEVILCSASGRSHETLFVTQARPLHLELLMLLTGFKKFNENSKFRLEILAPDGACYPVDSLIRPKIASDILPTPLSWEFSGSRFGDLYPPDQTGDFIICWHAHDSILRTTHERIASGEIKLEAKPHPSLPNGMAVQLLLIPLPHQ